MPESINARHRHHPGLCTVAGHFNDAADLRTAFKLAMQMLERAEKSANKLQKAREASVPMLWAIKGQKLRFTSVI